MYKAIILFLLNFNWSDGVLYSLNQSTYFKMPAMFHLDDYERCVNTQGVYCTATFNLVSDAPSELSYMLKEYSAHKRKHYNHSKLLYGICVTKCQKHYNLNSTKDLQVSLEECLNETMWHEYNLKTRIFEKPFCSSTDNKIEIEIADIVVAVVTSIVILSNVLCTIYEMYITQRMNQKGNKLLMCFSIKRNWNQLVKLNTNPKQLTTLNGVRVFVIILVVLTHSFTPFYIASNSSYFFEQDIYEELANYIFLNGTIVIQVFFVMSGFLLIYTADSKKYTPTWRFIPKGILLRLIRLLPPYIFVLAITSTWLRFAGPGPLRSVFIDPAVNDCRQFGWRHLAFVNNYLDNSQCMVHTWYLAADMQLYIVGLCVYAFLRSTRSRQIGLGILLTIGFLLPALSVYLLDIDPTLIVEPEAMRNYQVTDPSYNNIYRRGHTNLADLVIGLALGYFVIWLRNNPNQIQKYKKYLWVYWFTVPAMFGIFFLNNMFYIDGFDIPMYARVIYAALIKPCFGAIFAIALFGSYFKFEHIYAGIMNWPVWAMPSKLSYSMYLVHFLLIRYVSGTANTLLHFTKLYTITLCLGYIALTFIAAVPIYLFIEEPVTQMLKLCLQPEDEERKEKHATDDIKIEVQL